MSQSLQGDAARTRTSPPRAGIQYALARTYYQVYLVSTDTDLKLQIVGPLFEADLGQMHQLDMRHSTFASDRFEIDRDENNMLKTISLQSRGRANAIAYGIGASLGALAAGSPGAALGPRNEAADETNGPPPRAPVVLLSAHWRPGHDTDSESLDTSTLEARANAVIQSWFAEACGTHGACAPARAPTLQQRSALAEAATSEAAPDCRLVICYSAQARANLQINITPAAAPTPRPTPRGRRATPVRTVRVQDADIAAARSISIVDPAVTSSHYEFVDPRMAAVGGGSMQLVFQRGALSYVSFARGSEVESAVLLPYDVVRGVANSIYSVLPIRVAIDYQRRQLDTVNRAETPTAPTAPTGTPVGAISNADSAPPDNAAAAAAAVIEAREPPPREFILAQRAGGTRPNVTPPVKAGAGTTPGTTPDPHPTPVTPPH